MAYKVFTNGSVLNASEMNEYLMNQSVITFSNSTARSSAITSPVEGMITYLEDSNSYQSWDGSAWVGLVPQSGNAIINGAFEINQRNFTSSTVNGYGFDRWNLSYTNGTVTYSSQAFTPGAAPVAGYESANHARIVTSGQSGTDTTAFVRQPIEDVRTFANQTVTVSFFAKAASGTPSLSVELDQQFGSGGSTRVTTLAGKVTLSTSWQRFSLTVAVPSVSGKTIGANSFLSTLFWVSAGSNFDARTNSLGIQSNTFDIWGVQLEAGSVATPFRRNANSLAGELAACQRYYFRTDASAGTNLSLGQSNTTTAGLIFINFPVSMRVPPTSLDQSGTPEDYAIRRQGSTIVTCSAVPSLMSANKNAGIANFTVASGLAAGEVILYRSLNANGFLGWSAEL